MRANGVPDFPDPKAGGGFLLHTGAGVEPVIAGVQGGTEQCAKFLPPGPGAGRTAVRKDVGAFPDGRALHARAWCT